MRKDNTVSFETYKKTRSLEQAEREQKSFEWKVNTQIELIRNGRIDDAEDLLIAFLGVKENVTTDEERKKCIRIISEIENKGFQKEAEELRWRLNKYLSIERG